MAVHGEGQFALVSTVDSVDLGIGGQSVFVFATEGEAVQFAVDLLVNRGQLIHEAGNYWFPTDTKDTPTMSATDALDAWQEGLDSIEYFHVMSVLEAGVKVEE